MSDVSRILQAIDRGEPAATEQLLPLVYQELRRLARRRLADERPGQTLTPTGLVHEAFVRLVDVQHQPTWQSRGHFFSAAAEAMRRILVENARRKASLKRGGGRDRQDLVESQVASPRPAPDVIALDEALDRLEQTDTQAARLVKLRYFSGLTVAEAAAALGVSTRTAERLWTFAKAWLLRELDDRPADG